MAGFGDPATRILVVGLAPAAHGGNRTGRIFTGDRSGDFLYASLHRAGLSNQPQSTSRDDGLKLRGVYLASVNRCAPPGNRPTPEERDTCLPYLVRELRALPPKQAGALVLRHLHGFTNREIGAALGIPERTVASRLAAAKSRIRARLGNRIDFEMGTSEGSTVPLDE